MSKTYSRDRTGAGMFQFDPGWLAKHDEEVLDPTLPIIDPHHHLWDRDNSYLFNNLLDDTGIDGPDRHNIRATVYIQCRSMYRAGVAEALAPVGETEFVNGIAAQSATGHYGEMRACAGIVSHADFRLGAKVREVLEAHIAASDRFRGIRFSTPWDNDVKLTPEHPLRYIMADKTWREGYAELGKLNLVYDALLFHTQLGELADLAGAFPGTPIVLNHVGCPIGMGPYASKRQEIFADWKKGIAALAEHNYVVVKLGGLGMHVFGFDLDKRPKPPSSEELATLWKPYIDTCIDAFGIERCMFESNFPVDKLAGSYKTYWNAFKRLAAGCSPDEKASLFHDTAARVYRLGRH